MGALLILGVVILAAWWLLKKKKGFNVCQYDENGDGIIDWPDTVRAIDDCVKGKITGEEAERVTNAYRAGTHCSLH